MSTPSDREKIFDKLTKEWDQIGDESLIKDVATKGRYVNLLISFLSKRNSKSIPDTKHYFNSEVDKYVQRLLSNRQVHKAELVLRNTNRDPKPIFYEFAMSPTSVDEDIKERIVDHLLQNNASFEQERDEFDYYLNVLKLVAGNKSLRRQFDREIQEFTLEALYQKDFDFRRTMAVKTCFHCRNAVLVDKLDKISTWKYLWTSEQFLYLAKWLELLYISRTGGESPESDTHKKELHFDSALRNLFLSWDIGDAMFEEVKHSESKLSDFLVNSFVKNGMIFDFERNNTRKLFQRVFTTLSLSENRQWLLDERNMRNVIEAIVEKNDLFLLMEHAFSEKIIENAASDFENVKMELELCQTFKSATKDDRPTHAAISSAVSNFIIQNSDPDFYSKMPSILLCEQLISDVDIRELSESEAAAPILSKIPFIDTFFRRLHTTTCTDYSCTLADLLRLKNINLALIKWEANEKSSFVGFSNSTLSQKYGLTMSLNYVDYIRLRRSAYAAYTFFVDQLKYYSQISKAQIQLACGHACDLAVNHLDDLELVGCCVAFLEMLGVDSQNLRAYVQCLRLIKQSAIQAGEHLNVGTLQLEEIVGRTEKILLAQISDSPQALFGGSELNALRILSRSQPPFDLPLSFLKEVSSKSDWFHFLLFATFHNYSIRSIINVCQMDGFYNRDIGLNIGRALKEIIVDNEMPSAKRTASFSYREHKRKIQNRIDTNYLVNSSSTVQLPLLTRVQ